MKKRRASGGGKVVLVGVGGGGGGRGGGGCDGPFFSKGCLVEVGPQEEGFTNSWYQARIIDIVDEPKGQIRYQVEYDTIFKDDKGCERLREYVKVSHLRPLPPHEQPPSFPWYFELYDLVEAYDRDGWWTGVITGVGVNSNNEPMFRVSFREPPHEMEFTGSNLRVHYLWVDCNWVRAGKDKETMKSKGGVSNQKGKRGRPRKVLVESPRGVVKGSQDACAEKPSEEFGGAAHLTCHEGMNSPSTLGISLNNNVTHDENAMHPPAITSTDNEVSQGDNNSLFQKRSPIWKNIECMEIFQKIPQQPHFRPLYKSNEESREGSAIGHMVNFANVAEMTSTLKFSDPRSIIDSSLKMLSDLETHGFEVEPLRNRLNALLSEKEMEGLLLEERKGVEMKIAEHTLERREIGTEIDEMNKKLEELQENLAKATSMGESKDSEIASLESEKGRIDQDIQNAQNGFERLAAAPW